MGAIDIIKNILGILVFPLLAVWAVIKMMYLLASECSKSLYKDLTEEDNDKPVMGSSSV